MAEASSSTDQARPEPLPGMYTVVWGRNTREQPHFIKLAQTFGEGDATRWPEEGPDMTLLDNDHEKQRQWRKTAGDLLAKELGHYNNDNANHWMLADLPRGYALFQQVTHPKADQKGDPREGGKRDGGKRLRLDRFIFGHEGRKIRSAVSLGRHISWQLFARNGPCPCDGCKVIGKPTDAASPAVKGGPGKKRKAGDGYDDAEDSGEVSSTARGRGRPKLARTAASRAAAARGKGKKKGKGREWEDDDDDYDEVMYDDDDEDDEGAYSSDYTAGGGTRTTSSGRQSRPTSKMGQQQQYQQAMAAATEPPNDDISNLMTPAPPEVAVKASLVAVEDVQQDLRMPSCPRVGELVWCRVPLGRPPKTDRKLIGDADLSRWPGIVRKRFLFNKADPSDIRFKIELLAQNAKDSIDSVKLENLMPWQQFVPANTAHMDSVMHTWEGKNAEGQKKGWGNIQVEGWLGVVGAYWRAHRIAKCFAAIQIRSLPMIAVGAHLAAEPGVPALKRSVLKQMPPRSRFLTYSHILYGPELIHVGDFVRLNPDADLGPTIDRSGYDAAKTLLRMSPVLHVQMIYRGGDGSPLMARGPVYEMVELPERNEDQYRNNARAFGPELSTSILKTMPRPFPHHKWRLLSTRGEVDLLFESIAGRYHALNKQICDNIDSVDTVLKLADEKVEYSTLDKQSWAIAKGGYGMNGDNALRLTLAGLCGAAGTMRIRAIHGAMGNRDDQLRIAEEQATVIPDDPKLIIAPDPKSAAASAERQRKKQEAKQPKEKPA